MQKKVLFPGVTVLFILLFISSARAAVLSADHPFGPGEKLHYNLRWENVPAGKACLEIMPHESINGIPVYHFVLTAESNGFIDLFFKVRDRVDAFADLEMTRSVLYQRKQLEGRTQRDEIVHFDWNKGQVLYSNYGKKNDPIDLRDGSFDPLSAFYFTRTARLDVGHQLERPLTDGKKNGMGRLLVTSRERLTLSNGQSYDTYRVEPELNMVGGVFQASRNAKILLWVTADDKRIPVKIQSTVAIGQFIGELDSAQGVN